MFCAQPSAESGGSTAPPFVSNLKNYLEDNGFELNIESDSKEAYAKGSTMIEVPENIDATQNISMMVSDLAVVLDRHVNITLSNPSSST